MRIILVLFSWILVANAIHDEARRQAKAIKKDEHDQNTDSVSEKSTFIQQGGEKRLGISSEEAQPQQPQQTQQRNRAATAQPQASGIWGLGLGASIFVGILGILILLAILYAINFAMKGAAASGGASAAYPCGTTPTHCLQNLVGQKAWMNGNEVTAVGQVDGNRVIRADWLNDGKEVQIPEANLRPLENTAANVQRIDEDQRSGSKKLLDTPVIFELNDL